MAIAKCRECGKEVSTEAKVCPHCGVAKPAPGAGGQSVGVAVIILIAAAIGINYSSSTGSSTPAPSHARQSTPAELDDIARYGCSEFFSKSAHDPGSLEWIGRDAWPVRQLPDGMRDVDMQMRGKNKLGALVLTSKTCRVRQANGQTQLISFRD